MPAKPEPSELSEPVRPLMFAYTWGSTEEQALSRNGLEAQRAAIESEAQRRGWDVEYFSDEAASGKYINKNLREVLQLLRSGRGDGLVAPRWTGSTFNHQRGRRN